MPDIFTKINGVNNSWTAKLSQFNSALNDLPFPGVDLMIQELDKAIIEAIGEIEFGKKFPGGVKSSIVDGTAPAYSTIGYTPQRCFTNMLSTLLTSALQSFVAYCTALRSNYTFAKIVAQWEDVDMQRQVNIFELAANKIQQWQDQAIQEYQGVTGAIEQAYYAKFSGERGDAARTVGNFLSQNAYDALKACTPVKDFLNQFAFNLGSSTATVQNALHYAARATDMHNALLVIAYYCDFKVEQFTGWLGAITIELESR